MKNQQGRTRFLARVLPVAGGALALGMAMTVPSSATAPQASGTPLPGYWEYSTRVLGVGETETKCVRQSEINRFFGGLSTRRCPVPIPCARSATARPASRAPAATARIARCGCA